MRKTMSTSGLSVIFMLLNTMITNSQINHKLLQVLVKQTISAMKNSIPLEILTDIVVS